MIAKGPSSRHSPLSGSGSFLLPWVATAVVTDIMEDRVGEGVSMPMEMKEEAVAIAEERRAVGVAFSMREVSAGSKPGGGCISRSMGSSRI